ncbi:NAC domain-containing protein 83 [Linum grandiflorum]
MEKQSMVVNGGGGGGMKLPIGYRFRPTDEELIVHYLRRKVFGLPLPASVIPDLDVFNAHLSTTLPPAGNPSEKRYFFCKGDDHGSNKIVEKGEGYWKHTGKARHIVASSSNNQLVGMRRSLVFQTHGKRKKNQTYKWVMHEFCLVGLVTIPFTNQISMVKVGDWVLCSVFQKKRRSSTTTNKKKLISRCSSSPNPVTEDNEMIRDHDSMNIRVDELSDAGPSCDDDHEEEGEEDVKVGSWRCSSGIRDLSCAKSSSSSSGLLLVKEEDMITSSNVSLSCSSQR